MIKFQVFEEAKEAVLYFVQDLSELLTAKCIDLSSLIDYSLYSTYFNDVIQCYYF